VYIFYRLIFISEMIYLMDILNEIQLSKYQIFSPGTGGKEFGNMKFDPTKIPTKLNISSMVQYGGQCINKPTGAFWTSSYKQKFKGSAWTSHKKMKFPTWHTSMGAVFEIKGSPKILKIRSHNDYMKVQKKAKLDASNKCGAGDMYMDWKKVSKMFDGVQLAGSIMSIPMLGQWDVESTCWFNMKKLEFVGTTKV